MNCPDGMGRVSHLYFFRYQPTIFMEDYEHT